MQGERLTPGVMIVRFLTALLLVYATFNPEGMSFFHWAALPVLVGQGIGSVGPLKVAAGSLLLISWLVFLQTTRRSIGTLRAVSLFVLVGITLGVLINRHLADPSGSRRLIHLALAILCVALTLGLSWSPAMKGLPGHITPDRAA